MTVDSTIELPKELSTLWEFIFGLLEFKLFELNNTPVTMASIILFLIFIAVFFFISRLFNRGLLRRILRRSQMDPGLQFTLVRVGHYTVMIIGSLVAFQFVGLDLSGLAVIFGLLSVGIGFGLQNVTSNFVAGLILLFERPISIGDRITVGDTEGDVIAINMRSTKIRTLNAITIIVPNSEFVSSNVINWSHGDPRVRIDLDVGVSYNSDLDLVLASLAEVAEEHPKVLRAPKADVLFREFGDSSWNLQLRAWIADPKGNRTITSELNQAIVRKFREKNIEIPFPQRDIHVRSPLPVPFSQMPPDDNSTQKKI